MHQLIWQKQPTDLCAHLLADGSDLGACGAVLPKAKPAPDAEQRCWKCEDVEQTALATGLAPAGHQGPLPLTEGTSMGPDKLTLPAQQEITMKTTPAPQPATTTPPTNGETPADAATKRRAQDQELHAMTRIARTLDEMEPATRERVMDWL